MHFPVEQVGRSTNSPKYTHHTRTAHSTPPLEGVCGRINGTQHRSNTLARHTQTQRPGTPSVRVAVGLSEVSVRVGVGVIASAHPLHWDSLRREGE